MFYYCVYLRAKKSMDENLASDDEEEEEEEAEQSDNQEQMLNVNTE